MKLDKFINRPVLSTVISILIVILGVIGLATVEVEEVEWTPGAEGERPVMKPTGKKEILKADLVLLAMGFLRPVQPEFPANVFVAGDAATGASLVVKCIAGGRKAAADIDAYLSRK